MKRARKAYETEMRRRVKFMRTFSEKYMEYREFLRLDQKGNHTMAEWHEEAEEEFESSSQLRNRQSNSRSRMDLFAKHLLTISKKIKNKKNRKTNKK